MHLALWAFMALPPDELVASHGNMHQVSSGLASCRRCNAVAVSANGLNALFT